VIQLGRLVRVQSPFPEPAPGETGLLRTERLFYDGVRRIQEVIIDPAVSLDGALAGEGGAALQGEAQLIASNAAEELDGAATPAMLESVQLGEGDGGGASQMNGTSMTPGTTTMLAREYVWGPGDWGVDELLVQYDAARRATWPILDSGADVIALCDLGNPNNSARVLTNIVYDAYGRVIGRSDPATPATGPPELRVGHKGLFFDRLDWGIVDPLTLEETPRLEPGATLLGYNRNRTLHVGWGRFLQRDPNATGLPVQAGLGFHGEGLGTGVQRFDLGLHYGDGVNVYEYLRSTPLGGSDPAGLFFSIGEVMGSSSQSVDLYTDYNDTVLDVGKSAAAMIRDWNFSYGLNQMLDMAWASDWSAGDDEYSHAVVTESEAIESVSGSRHIQAGMRLPSLAGFNRHHPFTNKHKKYTTEILNILNRAGVKDKGEALQWLDDVVFYVDKKKHKGRHKHAYHDRVVEELSAAMSAVNKNGTKKEIMANARKAFEAVAAKVKNQTHAEDILNNPNRR
jgi:hypothetical protein